MLSTIRATYVSTGTAIFPKFSSDRERVKSTMTRVIAPIPSSRIKHHQSKSNIINKNKGRSHH